MRNRGPMQDWCDTLRDLGLVGFVREPAPEAPPAPAPSIPAPAERSAPLRPVQVVEPAKKGFIPSPEAVASASTLEELDCAINKCMACPLGGARLRFVFGEGDPKARLMFIGEGPGRDEDIQGRPFVGKAGELLDKMIGAIGLKRTQVYIANVVKCRPPDNRTPTPGEAGCCLPYLKRQIELIRPEVIVTLGATPLRELLGVTQGITKVRGQWMRLEMLGGIPVMPTFHPAYVLRQYTQDVRRMVWNDLLAAKAWLEKQS